MNVYKAYKRYVETFTEWLIESIDSGMIEYNQAVSLFDGNVNLAAYRAVARQDDKALFGKICEHERLLKASLEIRGLE